MSNELTGIVAEHIAAVNAHDTERIAATFAPDAVVNLSAGKEILVSVGATLTTW